MWHSAAEAPRPSAVRCRASPLAVRDPRGLVYNVAARQSPHRRVPRDGDGLARSAVRGLLQRVLVLLSVAPRSMGPGPCAPPFHDTERSVAIRAGVFVDYRISRGTGKNALVFHKLGFRIIRRL